MGENTGDGYNLLGREARMVLEMQVCVGIDMTGMTQERWKWSVDAVSRMKARELGSHSP